MQTKKLRQNDAYFLFRKLRYAGRRKDFPEYNMNVGSKYYRHWYKIN